MSRAHRGGFDTDFSGGGIHLLFHVRFDQWKAFSGGLVNNPPPSSHADIVVQLRKPPTDFLTLSYLCLHFPLVMARFMIWFSYDWPPRRLRFGSASGEVSASGDVQGRGWETTCTAFSRSASARHTVAWPCQGLRHLSARAVQISPEVHRPLFGLSRPGGAPVARRLRWPEFRLGLQRVEAACGKRTTRVGRDAGVLLHQVSRPWDHRFLSCASLATV